MTGPARPGAPSIALVDDDRHLLASLSMTLEAEGFEVRTYADGAAALRGLSARPPDLAILDVKMPRMDGMALLERLRRAGDLPVILLTSKDDEAGELLGLRMGADDYVRKPFSQRLLVARVRTVLRRHGRGAAAGDDEPARPPLRRGDLSLDAGRFACSWRGRPVALTVTEFLLLEELARHPGHVKSRDRLMDAAYGESSYVDDRAIDSHIKRLRRKFRLVDDGFREIETMYGVGYRYRSS